MHKINNTSTQKYKTTFLVVYIIFIIDLSISVMIIAVVNTLPNGMLRTEGTAGWFDLTTQQLTFSKASKCL